MRDSEYTWQSGRGETDIRDCKRDMSVTVIMTGHKSDTLNKTQKGAEKSIGGNWREAQRRIDGSCRKCLQPITLTPPLILHHVQARYRPRFFICFVRPDEASSMAHIISSLSQSFSSLVEVVSLVRTPPSLYTSRSLFGPSAFTTDSLLQPNLLCRQGSRVHHRQRTRRISIW